MDSCRLCHGTIDENWKRSYPAREIYRAYLAQSDIFVGIYWQSYGALVPAMGISGLEDEYQLSSGKPRLIYIKQPAPCVAVPR